MDKGTIRSALQEFFPNGTLPSSLADDAKESDQSAQKHEDGLSSGIWHFPIWPPDLFAAMALLLERSGAYAFWEPSRSFFLDLSKEAEEIGVEWSQYYVGPENGSRFALQKRVFDDLEPDPGDFSVQENLFFELQSRWLELIEDSGDALWSKPLSDDDGEIEAWCLHAMQLLIIADEASIHLGTPRAMLVDESGDRHLEDVPWTSAILEYELFSRDSGVFLSKETKSAIWSASSQDTTGIFETLTLQMDKSIANVLPKMRTPQVGATLRAFSHYLALLPGSQEVRTTWYRSPFAEFGHRLFNILVVPFPFSLTTDAFVAKDLSDFDRGRWGSFTIEQKWLEVFGRSKDEQAKGFVEFLKELLFNAEKSLSNNIHCIVFPEAAISAGLFEAAVEWLAGQEGSKVELLIAGVAGDTSDFSEVSLRSGQNSDFDINVVGIAHFNTPGPGPAPQAKSRRSRKKVESNTKKLASVFYQPKHHRWKIDRSQMKAYGLATRLGGVEYRWENISTDLRHIQFLPIRCHGVIATLICEDLARIDPCQTVLRAIGPNLVVALLMDGPQLTSRWPNRYATVLSEDPGSSVLSVTSAALVDRNSKCGGFTPNHSVGLWRDQTNGVIPIELEPRAAGFVLSLEARSVEERTMDDRSDGGTATCFEYVAVTMVNHESIFFDPEATR